MQPVNVLKYDFGIDRFFHHEDTFYCDTAKIVELTLSR